MARPGHYRAWGARIRSRRGRGGPHCTRSTGESAASRSPCASSPLPVSRVRSGYFDASVVPSARIGRGDHRCSHRCRRCDGARPVAPARSRNSALGRRPARERIGDGDRLHRGRRDGDRRGGAYRPRKRRRTPVDWANAIGGLLRPRNTGCDAGIARSRRRADSPDRLAARPRNTGRDGGRTGDDRAPSRHRGRPLPDVFERARAGRETTRSPAQSPSSGTSRR